MQVRGAHAGDVQAISVTLAGAFANDPVWSWAFPDVDQLQVWWRFWVAAAVPQGEVRLTEHAEAVAVWLPPGGFEIAPEDEAHLEPLLRALIGERAPLVHEVLASFDEHHPQGDYYYLTLFGTAPAHRGHGIGMQLLAENLATIDEQHAAAYLESSNPVNIPRYEAVGFAPIGDFELPEHQGTVTTMWRDPR